jgi:hypothetical protein
MSEDVNFMEVTGKGVRLGPSWPALPTTHLGVGIGFLPDALLAWCAPKLGRVSTCIFAIDAALDRLDLTAWLIDQGFGADEAAAASCELISRLNTGQKFVPQSAIV